MRKTHLARVLAPALLAGEPTIDQITARLTHTFGRSWKWLRPLARRYAKFFAERPRPHRRDVVRFLVNDRGFQRVRSSHRGALVVKNWLNEPQRMQPVATAASWNVPPIESVGDLAEWLGISVNDLFWLADIRGLAHKQTRPLLRNYHFRILPKSTGHIRLIEIPKPRLKELQRQILVRILEKIPPHPAVHGFLKQRSIQTFVAPHVNQHVVLRMDLQDFFPTFPSARIQAFFRTAGYPEAVADLLTGLCSTVTPRDVLQHHGLRTNGDVLREARDLYSRPHLPQGAPTSPALANICSYRLDCRLAGLANTVGARYTRYADDLAFSGGRDFERHVDRFSLHVAALLMEEGLRVNHRKTRVMRQGVRQHLAGLVINDRANVPRPDIDRLKATLTNCVRHGPATQNREAHPHFRSHLEGRVAFAETIHPVKGSRLRALFQQIQWPEEHA